MTRTALFIGGAILWLLCFAAALFTIIPLSAISLATLFYTGSSIIERAEALGFVALGLIAVAVLLLTLTRLTRFFAKGHTRRADELSTVVKNGAAK